MFTSVLLKHCQTGLCVAMLKLSITSVWSYGQGNIRLFLRLKVCATTCLRLLQETLRLRNLLMGTNKYQYSGSHLIFSPMMVTRCPKHKNCFENRQIRAAKRHATKVPQNRVIGYSAILQAIRLVLRSPVHTYTLGKIRESVSHLYVPPYPYSKLWTKMS